MWPAEAGVLCPHPSHCAGRMVDCWHLRLFRLVLGTLQKKLCPLSADARFPPVPWAKMTAPLGGEAARQSPLGVNFPSREPAN